MRERPRALFFTPEVPYPMIGGGATRSASLLEWLSCHYEVDVVTFRQPGAAEPGGLFPPNLVHDVLALQLPGNSRNKVARAVRNAGRVFRRVPPLLDRFRGFGEPVSRYTAGRQFDISVVEHFWCAPYASVLAAGSRRLVLDLHNLESQLHARCAAAERGPEAFAHRVFARACADLERQWLPRFTDLLVTSDAAAQQALAMAPGTPVTVYPNSLPYIPAPPRREQDVVIFTGNLEYHPNVSAVRFFRHDIWPRLREQWPCLRWRLAGKNPHAIKRYVTDDDRIEVRGEMPDAVQELSCAKVAVVPLLAGSGTRFKILEAWAAGVPVVSTRIGAEGLPAVDGEHLLLADSPSDFSAAVSRLLSSEELRRNLGRRGRVLFEECFTWNSAWKMLEPFRNL